MLERPTIQLGRCNLCYLGAKPAWPIRSVIWTNVLCNLYDQTEGRGSLILYSTNPNYKEIHGIKINLYVPLLLVTIAARITSHGINL